MRKLVGAAVMLLALAGPAGAAGLDGTWSGTYVCGQGVTPLDLFITTPQGGYVTVNLLGTVGAAGYAGWVDGPGCSSFTLQRRQEALPVPAACRGMMVS